MRLRNKLIINELFYRDKVDLDELASLLKVSSRTIRLDIERINAYLIDKDLDVEVILKNNLLKSKRVFCLQVKILFIEI